MSKKLNLAKLTPVLFSFFVMGFVDIVNISTNYVKQDFALNDTWANLIPLLVFSGLRLSRCRRVSSWAASGVRTQYC